MPFLLAIEQPTEATETLLYLHQALTPPLVLAKIARTPGGLDGFILDDADGRLVAFTLLGLVLWMLGTAAVWFLASR